MPRALTLNRLYQARREPLQPEVPAVEIHSTVAHGEMTQNGRISRGKGQIGATTKQSDSSDTT